MPAKSFKRLLVRALCLGLGALLCLTVTADSRKREQQIAEQLLSRLEGDESLWLKSGRHKFLALHRAAFGALPRQAVLLVHHMGGHPDWPEVIAPLRTQLPERGWSTLSLQMPLLGTRALADDYGRTLPEAQRRIAAGVAFLRGQEYARIVIVGYGFGAAEALAYQAEYPTADGLIMIGILAREFLEPALNVQVLLAKIDVPLLDVYGGNDMNEVLRKAEDRRLAAARADNAAFQQQVVEGADHYFTGQDSRLVEIVGAWLDETMGGSDGMAGNGESSDGTR